MLHLNLIDCIHLTYLICSGIDDLQTGCSYLLYYQAPTSSHNFILFLQKSSRSTRSLTMHPSSGTLTKFPFHFSAHRGKQALFLGSRAEFFSG